MALAVTGTCATAAHADPTADLEKKITKASKDLDKVVETYNRARINRKKSEQAEVALKKSLGPAEKAMKTASADMQSIAATSYRQGQVSTLNVILDGRDGLLDRMSLLEQLSKSKQEKIDNYEATSQNFTTRQAALNATQVKLSAQIKDLAARKTKIEGNISDLRAMREAAYGQADAPSSKFTGTVPKVSGKAGTAVSFAYSKIGIPYVYGGADDSGYDCSGLTMQAWAAAGVSLDHSTFEQWDKTTRVDRSALAAGDLVFYNGREHVALYTGNGKVVDAPAEGQSVEEVNVDIPTLSIDGYGRIG